eukprot:s1379_g4.t1
MAILAAHHEQLTRSSRLLRGIACDALKVTANTSMWPCSRLPSKRSSQALKIALPRSSTSDGSWWNFTRSKWPGKTLALYILVPWLQMFHQSCQAVRFTFFRFTEASCSCRKLLQGTREKAKV